MSFIADFCMHQYSFIFQWYCLKINKVNICERKTDFLNFYLKIIKQEQEIIQSEKMSDFGELLQAAEQLTAGRLTSEN